LDADSDVTQLSVPVQTGRRDATTTDAPATAVPYFGRESVRFAGVLFQVGLLVLLIRRFDLERSPLGDVMLLAWAAFAVHHFLPLRVRLLRPIRWIIRS
jgi:hypothetical protein